MHTCQPMICQRNNHCTYDANNPSRTCDKTTAKGGSFNLNMTSYTKKSHLSLNIFWIYSRRLSDLIALIPFAFSRRKGCLAWPCPYPRWPCCLQVCTASDKVQDARQMTQIRTYLVHAIHTTFGSSKVSTTDETCSWHFAIARSLTSAVQAL